MEASGERETLESERKVPQKARETQTRGSRRGQMWGWGESPADPRVRGGSLSLSRSRVADWPELLYIRAPGGLGAWHQDVHRSLVQAASPALLVRPGLPRGAGLKWLLSRVKAARPVLLGSERSAGAGRLSAAGASCCSRAEGRQGSLRGRRRGGTPRAAGGSRAAAPLARGGAAALPRGHAGATGLPRAPCLLL